MNRLRDQFLADTALAGDQHLGVRVGDAFDLLLEIQHPRARSDQLGVAVLSHLTTLVVPVVAVRPIGSRRTGIAAWRDA